MLGAVLLWTPSTSAQEFVFQIRLPPLIVNDIHTGEIMAVEVAIRYRNESTWEQSLGVQNRMHSYVYEGFRDAYISRAFMTKKDTVDIRILRELIEQRIADAVGDYDFHLLILKVTRRGKYSIREDIDTVAEADTGIRGTIPPVIIRLPLLEDGYRAGVLTMRVDIVLDTDEEPRMHRYRTHEFLDVIYMNTYDQTEKSVVFRSGLPDERVIRELFLKILRKYTDAGDDIGAMKVRIEAYDPENSEIHIPTLEQTLQQERQR